MSQCFGHLWASGRFWMICSLLPLLCYLSLLGYLINFDLYSVEFRFPSFYLCFYQKGGWSDLLNDFWIWTIHLGSESLLRYVGRKTTLSNTVIGWEKHTLEPSLRYSQFWVNLIYGKIIIKMNHAIRLVLHVSGQYCIALLTYVAGTRVDMWRILISYEIH